MAIAFWKHLLIGASGLLVLGFIGSLFGDGWMVLGGLVGLVGGIGLAKDRNVKDTEAVPALETKYSTSNQSSKGIIRKAKDVLSSFLLIAALLTGIFLFSAKDEPNVVSGAGWIANTLFSFNPVGLLRKATKK